MSYMRVKSAYGKLAAVRLNLENFQRHDISFAGAGRTVAAGRAPPPAPGVRGRMDAPLIVAPEDVRRKGRSQGCGSKAGTPFRQGDRSFYPHSGPKNARITRPVHDFGRS